MRVLLFRKYTMKERIAVKLQKRKMHGIGMMQMVYIVDIHMLMNMNFLRIPLKYA